MSFNILIILLYSILVYEIELIDNLINYLLIIELNEL